MQHIVNTIENGTKFISKETFKKINGVYFNSKYNEKTNKPIIGLEIADISSYPIHKYVKYNKKDLAFKTLEKKLCNYPNYNGKGLKIYPKNSKISTLTFYNSKQN